MNFCSHCGSNDLQFAIPPGDTRPRYWCQSCNTIHYSNPNLVVGTIATWEGKILLCKRAIEPRLGYWTLPAGFMENGETLQEGAARETWEEAGASVVIKDIYSIFNVSHVYQVHVFFLADMVSGHYQSGEESLETALFSVDEIPWQELSFQTVRRTLELYLEDLKRGEFPIRVQEVNPTRGV